MLGVVMMYVRRLLSVLTMNVSRGSTLKTALHLLNLVLETPVLLSGNCAHE